MGVGKRFFEAGDGFDLALPHVRSRTCHCAFGAGGDERMIHWHSRQTGADGVGFGEPSSQRFGAMKAEYRSRTRVGIAFVAEKGFNAGGFVKERQRTGNRGGEEVREIHRVMAGLLGDTAQERAFLFGFNDADRFAVNEQEIIAGAGFERDFAEGDAAPGRKINFGVVLNGPA